MSATFLASRVDYVKPMQLVFVVTDAAVPGGFGIPGDAVLVAGGAPLGGAGNGQPYAPNVRVSAGRALDNAALRAPRYLFWPTVCDVFWKRFR